jgi:hypothetical protein
VLPGACLPLGAPSSGQMWCRLSSEAQYSIPRCLPCLPAGARKPGIPSRARVLPGLVGGPMGFPRARAQTSALWRPGCWAPRETPGHHEACSPGPRERSMLLRAAPVSPPRSPGAGRESVAHAWDLHGCWSARPRRARVVPHTGRDHACIAPVLSASHQDDQRHGPLSGKWHAVIPLCAPPSDRVCRPSRAAEGC